MSRWHDRSAAGIAAWANLSVEERIADRLSDIQLAALEIEELTSGAVNAARTGIGEAARRMYDEADALRMHLPEPRDIPSRSGEMYVILERIRRALEEISILRGPDYDAMLGWVETLAAVDALSLYYEIQRLDALLGQSSHARHALS